MPPSSTTLASDLERNALDASHFFEVVRTKAIETGAPKTLSQIDVLANLLNSPAPTFADLQHPAERDPPSLIRSSITVEEIRPHEGFPTHMPGTLSTGMTQIGMTSNIKGANFESEVNTILQALERKFSHRVKIAAQVEFNDVARPHRADFELQYVLGGLTHQHLIECQHRKRSSNEIADKIYAVKGTTDRGRYIFVYKDRDYLSEPVAKRLNNMGVLCFDLAGFGEFITQLEADIALHEIGLTLLQDPTNAQWIHDCLDNIRKCDDEYYKHTALGNAIISKLQKLMESGSKYRPGFNRPYDRGMIVSGRR